MPTVGSREPPSTATPGGTTGRSGSRPARVGSLWLRVSDNDIRGGGAAGPPLLLVNGLGANIEMWAPLRRALAPRRTIAFDAPGTGGSSTPVRPLTIRE